jgi:hypothetical protein
VRAALPVEECAREQVKVGQHGLGLPAVVVDVPVLESSA